MTALRRMLLLAAVVAAPLAAAAQAASAPSLRLVPVGSVAFPDRAFVLAASRPLALTSAQVQVRENGRPVPGVSVVPASATRAFGVVLVLDASDSMAGAPIARAVEAARAFVSRRAPGEAIGLVAFNRSTHVVAAPTTDAGTLTAALRTAPSLAVGTHLWDAAAVAIDALRRDRVTAGSLVLLSDGADTGSRLTAQALAAKASAAGVRVFAVGLRSPQFDPGPLRTLAGATRAAFVEADSPASLTTIYRSLSMELAREYLLRYHSPAGPGRSVSVEVRLAGTGSVAGTTYRTPGLPRTPSAPFHRSWVDRLVSSPASVALVVLLVALLAAFGVNALLRPGRNTLRHRIGEFVSVEGEGGTASPQERLPSRLLAAAERGLQGTPAWERFSEELEIAEYPVRPAPLAAMTIAASVVLALFGFVSPVLALLALAPPLLVRASYKGMLRKRRAAFEEQLPDNLTVLAASLRAGHSFVTGLASVVDQADEPSRGELRRALADEQLGVPIEDGLLRVARRMASGDLEQVALVASLQRQTGGNTAEVLDVVVDSIRERFRLRRTVMALTAQGRMARWILIALPIVVAGWLGLVNPHYMSVLLHTGTGQALLAVAVALVVIGSVVVKRITDIEL